jgi:hypothetical protein
MKLDEAPCEHCINIDPKRSWSSWFLRQWWARCLWCGQQWGPFKTEDQAIELAQQESR